MSVSVSVSELVTEYDYEWFIKFKIIGLIGLTSK